MTAEDWIRAMALAALVRSFASTRFIQVHRGQQHAAGSITEPLRPHGT
ncbi:MAG: hypothetical protein LBC97_09740 [Bifidobacteriaceae bacterium]|jgi:hypothetical protein|nr:hypothetical protein [Bifidobacteriaceae bacterium]